VNGNDADGEDAVPERSDELPERGGDWPFAQAIVAVLAVLFGAAVAAGMGDGVLEGRWPGQAAAGRDAALAVAVRHGPALPSIPRLCFRNPRGEPVDFPVAQHHCPSPAVEAGPRLAGMP
jgi:hypothetical protein